MIRHWHCGLNIHDYFLKLKIDLDWTARFSDFTKNKPHDGRQYFNDSGLMCKAINVNKIRNVWSVKSLECGLSIGAKWWRGGGCVAGSWSPGCWHGPARDHLSQPARSGHARSKLRAHHEEIFQIRYAGLRSPIIWKQSLA